jgi:hypothetical protein
MSPETGDRKPEEQTGLGLWGYLALGLLLTLAGCCPTTLEQDYGRSVRNNIAQQLVNPQAGLDTTPAVGLPPQVGHNALERYEKSFKEKEPPPTIINITR